MKKLFVAVIAGLLGFSAYGQHTYKLDLNHEGTIIFPDTPQAKTSAGETVYTLGEGGIVYLTLATPVKKTLVDMFTTGYRDSLFAGIVSGSLNNPECKLLYRRKTTSNGLEGIEFCYTRNIKGAKFYCFHQCFYTGKTLIVSGYWSQDSLKNDDKGMRGFFGSLILKKGAPARQSAGYRIGHIIGETVAYVVMLAVIAGVIIGIIFLAKRTKKKSPPMG